jgi:hypothetical protein
MQSIAHHDVIRDFRGAVPRSSALLSSVRAAPRFPTAVRSRGRGGKLIEECLRLFEICAIEAFSKPAVDRREKITSFGALALVAPQPGEASRGAQLPQLRILLPGNAQGFAIEFLGGFGMPLPQQQLALKSVQLRREPVLPCPVNDLQCFAAPAMKRADSSGSRKPARRRRARSDPPLRAIDRSPRCSCVQQ